MPSTSDPQPTPPAPRAPQRRRSSRGLVALNAALLVALAGVTLAPPADAQNQSGVTRARGEYTMVGGEISGGNANAVYIVDAANREMIALYWDEARRVMQGVGYRDLATDLVVDPQR
jgi:hypothetical protein